MVKTLNNKTTHLNNFIDTCLGWHLYTGLKEQNMHKKKLQLTTGKTQSAPN